jgi:hypothetical protein
VGIFFDITNIPRDFCCASLNRLQVLQEVKDYDDTHDVALSCPESRFLSGCLSASVGVDFCLVVSWSNYTYYAYDTRYAHDTCYTRRFHFFHGEFESGHLLSGVVWSLRAAGWGRRRVPCRDRTGYGDADQQLR